MTTALHPVQIIGLLYVQQDESVYEERVSQKLCVENFEC